MKSKWIDDIGKITSKRHDVFTENLTISFSNAEKTGNLPEFFTNSRRPSFGHHINVTFIS